MIKFPLTMICRGSPNRDFMGKKDQAFESWLISIHLNFKWDLNRKILSWSTGEETKGSIYQHTLQTSYASPGNWQTRGGGGWEDRLSEEGSEGEVGTHGCCFQ